MKKVLETIIPALLIIIIIIGMLVTHKKAEYKEYVTFESRIDELENSELKDETNVYGWIQVQGTNIDYPVIEERESIFFRDIDYIWRLNTYIEGMNREAISGHNIQNISNKPLIADPRHKRFEQLMSFVDYDFAKKNLYIQYTKDGKDELYKIYAVSFLDYQDEDGRGVAKEQVADYIKNAKKESIYNYDVDVKDTDTIIALVTCTRYFGAINKTNFRVDARKVRKNEKIQKYNVETSKNYDIINYDR